MNRPTVPGMGHANVGVIGVKLRVERIVMAMLV